MNDGQSAPSYGVITNGSRNTEDKSLQPEDKSLKPFIIISSSYLLFTVTDGAIRMIVLMHAYSFGFSAMQVALMFVLYELAGVVTNLLAGMAGSRWGLRMTLLTGLFLQIFSYFLLFFWDENWSKSTAIVYVTIAQMFAGVAKDLTKLGGKVVTKLVTPEGRENKLFKLVSLLTGMKNSLKGVGYFLGSALLSFSYNFALSAMITLVVLAIPAPLFFLSNDLAKAKKKDSSLKEIFTFDNRNLNFLSLARVFLFASRDFWFEVPLPFYLRSPSCEGLGVDVTCSNDDECESGSFCNDLGGESFCANENVGGGCGGLGLDRVLVGTFLACYIILYGQVQSWTPQLVTGPLKQSPPNKITEVLWGIINIFPTLVGAFVLFFSDAFVEHEKSAMTIWLICIIVVFAIVFAINSSIHSYLVVRYASESKIAVSVGFYYMSNAVGRLFGTLGSGILYTYIGENEGVWSGTNGTVGMASCFIAGTISSLLAATITIKIEDDEAGLNCGRFICVAKKSDYVERIEKEGGGGGGGHEGEAAL